MSDIPVLVKDLIRYLQNLTHIGKIEKIDLKLAKHLYSNLIKYYQPQITSFDGNCVIYFSDL